jgi:hypothetical protein
MCQKLTHAPQLRAGHSITSSARARKEGGTVRPSAFAVLRLTTSSNDVGALGGEPPGGGQADAAVAPGDDRDFALQRLPPLPVRAIRATGYEYVRPPHHTLTTTLPICWFDSR